MKSILISTLHSQNNNFGSVIQGYALYSYIKELGYIVTTLDYRPNYSNGKTDIKSRIKRIGANTLFLPFFLRRQCRFKSFVQQEVLTKRYRAYHELEKANLPYDIFMIGSDQVWNSEHNCGKDPTYYLKFTVSKNKISYAASLGRKIENEVDIKRLISQICDFRMISVRENYSATQLQNAGLKNVKYVLDPVFLYTAAHYRALQSKKKESGYILAYVIHSDPLLAQIIERLASLLNKKVIQVGGFASKCKYDSFPRDAGPREFLSLVDNADFIITSSFHGTAFSIIYEKQFAVVMPHANTLRLENILETAGLTERIIKSLDDTEEMLKLIDYNEPTRRIDSMRKESQEYLSTALAELGGE